MVFRFIPGLFQVTVRVYFREIVFLVFVPLVLLMLIALSVLLVLLVLLISDP